MGLCQQKRRHDSINGGFVSINEGTAPLLSLIANNDSEPGGSVAIAKLLLVTVTIADIAPCRS
eukprot:2416066-Rhodomonas_salina.4